MTHPRIARDPRTISRVTGLPLVDVLDDEDWGPLAPEEEPLTVEEAMMPPDAPDDALGPLAGLAEDYGLTEDELYDHHEEEEGDE